MAYRRIKKTLPERHTERSRNYGRTAYRTESRITLAEAYQMTTEKLTDILPKLPTQMPSEKSTNKSTTKLTGKVYQVGQDSLKHRRNWNQPLPKYFHWGRRIRGSNYGKISKGKFMGEARSQPRYPPRCPQSWPPRSSLPKCLPLSQLDGHQCYVPNYITEKHLQVNANCQWLPIFLIPHEDYRYCMKYAEALYQGSEEHKRT